MIARGGFVRIADDDGAALPDIAYSVPDVPPENERKSDFLSRRTGFECRTISIPPSLVITHIF